MALRLIPDSDPRLHRACAPVTDPEQALALALEMADHLDLFSAVGLSANQVGRDLALFVMRAPTGEIWACANPQWAQISAEPTLMSEGCVSYPGQCLLVPRYPEIQANWWDPRTAQEHCEVLTGVYSQCFQHEWDHTQGRTMWDSAQLSRRQRRRR